MSDKTFLETLKQDVLEILDNEDVKIIGPLMLGLVVIAAFSPLAAIAATLGSGVLAIIYLHWVNRQGIIDNFMDDYNNIKSKFTKKS